MEKECTVREGERRRKENERVKVLEGEEKIEKEREGVWHERGRDRLRERFNGRKRENGKNPTKRAVEGGNDSELASLEEERIEK